MKHPLAAALAIALTGAVSADASAQSGTPEPTVAAQATSAAQQQSNPLFVESPLPLQYPQFDRIADSDFAPAFDAGMAQELAEIEAKFGTLRAALSDDTLQADRGNRRA